MSGWCIVIVAAVGWVAVCAPAAGQCQYAVVEPIIQAGSCGVVGPPATFATGVNSHGHVVGYYAHCSISGYKHGFIWKPGTGLVTLPEPPDTVELWPTDITDDGLIVGYHRFYLKPGRGFVLDPNTNEYTFLAPLHQEVYDNPVAPEVSRVRAVNESGIAVGTRIISEGGVSPPVRNAVLWNVHTGEIVDLGLVDGKVTVGSAGNEWTDAAGCSGQVSCPSVNTTAILWTDGVAIEIGGLPGDTLSSADAVNSFLEVVGSSSVSQFVAPDGFHWFNGQMVALTPPEPFEKFRPYAITDWGQIAGILRISANQQFAGLLQHGEFHEIQNLVVNLPPSVTTLVGAGPINIKGQIRVGADLTGGKFASLLLTPVNVPPGDFHFDCKVGVADLLFLLSEWGKPGSRADLNGDGTVGVPDLLILLANWGP